MPYILYHSIRYFIKKLRDFIIYYSYCMATARFDYFHYSLMKYCIPIFSISDENGIMGNKCYGNNKVLKNYFKKRFDRNCMIEHGVYFGRVVLADECTIKNVKTIYTYSQYRIDCINEYFKGKLNKKVIAVGPYIMYANNFKNKESLQKIKRQYGKILLVFPSHQSPECNLKFDDNALLSEIDTVARWYDSVFISLFWLDIKKGFDKLYKQKGYTVVCSGSRSDPCFLSREKDLIQLADMSMSNDVGTHIGYCIALGTPHYLFKQKILVEFKDNNHNRALEYSNIIRQKEYEEIFGAFNSSKPIITNRQRKIVEKYWGALRIY
jgi:hypothetical protein